LNNKLFLTFALENAPSWYHYANKERGWCIGSDSLYLITGCHKTDSWASAAYSETAGATSISLKLNIAKNAEGHASYNYSWENHHTVQGRVSSGSNTLKNQCVFARGFRISIKETLFPLSQSIKVDVTSAEKFKPCPKFKGSNNYSGNSFSRFISWFSFKQDTEADPVTPQIGRKRRKLPSTRETKVMIEPLGWASPVRMRLLTFQPGINQCLRKVRPSSGSRQ
jgi:hypothetical protein